MSELKELGPGIPMFYWLVKYMFGVLLFAFVLAGIACWASNDSADKASEWDEDNNSTVIDWSIGNHGNPDDDSKSPAWQAILHIVAALLMLISYYRLKQWLQRKEQELDLEVITPSDYTVIVKGLGSDFDVKEVEEYFKNYGREDSKAVDIVKSNIVYDIAEFTALCRKKGDLEVKKMLIEEFQRGD
jgi:hypothetical protein